jgi:hypothetical protein
MADKIPLKLTTGPNEIQEFAGSDTVGKANLPGDTVYTLTAQTLNNKTLLTSTQVSTLRANAATGPVVVSVQGVGTAGAENDHIRLQGQTAGQGALVAADHNTQPNVDLRLQAKGTGKVFVGANGEAIGAIGSQTLTNKTLVAPTIGASEFTNANHTHQSGATGGQLTTAAISSGVFNQTFVADAAYRTGSYAYGRGSSVLIDNATGSGQAQWANRPRVLQVQTGSYNVTPSPTAFTTFSVYSATLNTTSGVTMNTTPDCLVDTVGGPTPPAPLGTTKAGKVFKVTYGGRFNITLPAPPKSFQVQVEFEKSGTFATATMTGGTSAAPSNGRFWGTGYVMYTQAQGTLGQVRVWQDFPVFFGMNSTPTAAYDAAASTPEAAVTLSNGDTFYIRVKAAISASSVGDNMILDTAIYEALN